MRRRWVALTVLVFSVSLAIACGSSGRKSRGKAKGKPDIEASVPGASSPKSRTREAPPPSEGDVTIKVLADGTFKPAAVTVHKGATVTWEFADPYRQSVAPLKGEGPACSSIAPYKGRYADITGPMPRNPSGLFVLNQDGPGIRKGSGGQLTKDGPLGAITDASWKSDDNVGGFIRLRWNWLQPDREGAYDWSVLDREVEKAMANGKLYSIGVKAGFHGTPDWIFDAGVDKLIFRDFGTHSGVDGCSCGAFLTLGSPTQQRYQELYFEMLDAMAEHLKSNAAWYRHLAYVKPSGANLFSAENRLPKRCNCGSECGNKTCPVPKPYKNAPNLDSSGRICNTKVWAEAGYTPEGLYGFFDKQLRQLAESYPEKDFAFLLIHGGFPQVKSRSAYLGCGQEPKSARGLPEVTEQTKELLRRGWREHGERFTIQHAGLRADKRVNRMLRTERKPTQFIALQTTNDAHDTSELGSVVQHGIDEGALFIELYEEGTLNGKGGVLAQLNRKLHQRRRAAAIGKGPRRDPFPPTHSYTFNKEETLHFVNPATCGGDRPATGFVNVVP